LEIRIDDVDETPQGIKLSRYSFDENVSADYEVATLATTRADDQAELIGFALIQGAGDTDNAFFKIDGTRLIFNGNANFEQKRTYSVRIQSQFKSGAVFAESVELILNNVNEEPKDLQITKTTVDENIATTEAIAEVTFFDEDLNDRHTISLVSGTGSTDNDAFLIGGNKLYFKNSPDFESKNTYELRLNVIDAAGKSTENRFTLKIIDVNEAGTALSITENSVNENADSNTIVGRFETNDPDANDQQTFRFVEGKGAEGNEFFSIIDNQLMKKNPLNHEVKDSYSIRVVAEDKGGNSILSVLTIKVNDVNDAPTKISASKSLQLFENVAIGTLVANLTVEDEDANDTHTLRLIDGTGSENNALFDIENNRIVTKGEIDYEVDTLLSIRVSAVDQAGASI